MHCVFHSMAEMLDRILPVHLDFHIDYAWMIYQTIRTMAQGQQEKPTSGVIVPTIFRLVADWWGLEVAVQHRVCDQGHYINEAEKTLGPVGVAIARTTDYGEFVETITLRPAVYLCLVGHHAHFAEQVPREGGVLMALQFYQLPEKS